MNKQVKSKEEVAQHRVLLDTTEANDFFSSLCNIEK